jgi:hypothetical protein
MLSGHNFPPDELRKFSHTITTGMKVPYDPVALAICAEPIAEQDYYSKNITDTGRIRCMRCRKEFTSEDEHAICGLCRCEIEREVRVCFSCPAICDDTARLCQKCGAALSAKDAIKVKAIAQDIAFAVRRLYKKQSVIEESNFLAIIHRSLSPGDRALAEAELEQVAFYSAVLVLRKLTISNATVLAVTFHALEIYRQSFVLQGTTPLVAEALVNRYLKRFAGYDGAFARARSELPNSSEQWILFVAGDAVENCYGSKRRDLGTAMDMVLFIGYFVRTLTETTVSLLRKHAA